MFNSCIAVLADSIVRSVGAARQHIPVRVVIPHDTGQHGVVNGYQAKINQPLILVAEHLARLVSHHLRLSAVILGNGCGKFLGPSIVTAVIFIASGQRIA